MTHAEQPFSSGEHQLQYTSDETLRHRGSVALRQTATRPIPNLDGWSDGSGHPQYQLWPGGEAAFAERQRAQAAREMYADELI